MRLKISEDGLLKPCIWRNLWPESEKNVEVEHEAAMVVAEEIAILRVGDVRVHFKRIKVIGQIADGAR